MDLVGLLRSERRVRAVGFDDGPFTRGRRGRVAVAGVVTSDTRFEGLVWTQVRQDGWNATVALAEALEAGKFLPQIHVVLLDGIALAGFNVVDLPMLAARLQRPCVAVMRRPPDVEAVTRALFRLPRPARRLSRLQRAGGIHQAARICFQVAGAHPDVTAAVLERLTDRGHIPEALRLAHLIAGAVATGQSGHRA